MQLVLSPAKKLDFDTPVPCQSATQPALLTQSQQLITLLKPLSPQSLAALMKLSDPLAALNAARFENWHLPFTKDNARQAIFAFKGDVYEGMEAYQFSTTDIEFAQQHLKILSGLYGILRPLDLIQPYRLEMGTRLINPCGRNLYDFWGTQLTDALNRALQNKALQNTTLQNNDACLINLASQEYFKAVVLTRLQAKVITPIFKDRKNGVYKIISFYAKKARGAMARFIIQNKITQPENIQAFHWQGYRFNAAMSDDTQWVFLRDEV